MRFFKFISLWLTVYILFLLSAQTVHARPEYTYKYSSKCKTCHGENTAGELNEAGKAFKQKKLANTLEEPVKKVATTEEKPAPAPEESSTEKAKEESKESRPEHYRRVTKNGTIFFTDNPTSKEFLPASTPHNGHRSTKMTASEKKTKHRNIAKTRVPDASAKLQARLTKQSEVTNKMTFEECVQNVFVNQPLPENVQSAMDSFMAAESRCSVAAKHQ